VCPIFRRARTVPISYVARRGERPRSRLAGGGLRIDPNTFPFPPTNAQSMSPSPNHRHPVQPETPRERVRPPQAEGLPDSSRWQGTRYAGSRRHRAASGQKHPDPVRVESPASRPPIILFRVPRPLFPFAPRATPTAFCTDHPSRYHSARLCTAHARPAVLSEGGKGNTKIFSQNKAKKPPWRYQKRRSRWLRLLSRPKTDPRRQPRSRT
jgi:hypothetical protein